MLSSVIRAVKNEKEKYVKELKHGTLEILGYKTDITIGKIQGFFT